MFIKQCKAYDTDKVSLADINHLVNNDRWFSSIKYDGHYCQIHWNGSEAMFYTSSGKQFTNDFFNAEFAKLTKGPAIFEAEYLGTGEGMLGERVKAAVTTSAATNFKKSIPYYEPHKLVIFDIIHNTEFINRLRFLDSLRANTTENVKIASYSVINSYKQALEIADNNIANGYEGIIIKAGKHIYQSGKRVKTALKIKNKHHTVVTIMAVKEGIGKYTGAIGSFTCIDDDGLVVDVGSGLTDEIRLSKKDYIGRKIRISYERIDETYIFPIFKGFQE